MAACHFSISFPRSWTHPRDNLRCIETACMEIHLTLLQASWRNFLTLSAMILGARCESSDGCNPTQS
ncbi:hypothetical protein PAXRUDRAFT_786946 [Paxillus rubicundulus Ve08.2h10]|uniref:Uncharacterized protein n=1 Tax=Paxillus rubicundulus Ve08.2h10 TaxID=930991 RepID=A0A0D0CVT1_9AGAM|nr:hypothetical protein PAXRUDRAFT_786946 [Paxillus rubicundulus Ve08.2h10]